MLFFIGLFLFSIGLLALRETTFSAGPSPLPAAPRVDFMPWIALTTAIGSVLGTISTIILAWRVDRRTAKESELKLVQMQQQIKELEDKLSQQVKTKLIIP
jgi:membrane protein YqaA with SNARE-associated domain